MCSYNFSVPALIHLPLFEIPYMWEQCIPEGRYCNKRTPLHLRISKYGYFNIVLNWKDNGNAIKKAEGSVCIKNRELEEIEEMKKKKARVDFII